MSATRKLPRNTTKKGKKTTRGESLLPQLSGDAPSGFIGLRSGRKFESGYIVYLGRDVTPEMMLDDFCENNLPPDDRAVALDRLRAYVQALQSCKIGNLVSISYTARGLPLLKIEREYVLMEPNNRLP
jgi:hypothetical protein